jgi:hypothetical protein
LGEKKFEPIFPSLKRLLMDLMTYHFNPRDNLCILKVIALSPTIKLKAHP